MRDHTYPVIPDPAGRVTGPGAIEFARAIHRRYDGTVEPSTLSSEDYSQRFSNVCDLVVQLLWPEQYDTHPGDPDQHTSPTARTIARLILDTAGVLDAHEAGISTGYPTSPRAPGDHG